MAANQTKESDLSLLEETKIKSQLQIDLRTSKLRAKNFEEAFKKSKADCDLIKTEKQLVIREKEELAALLEQRD